MVTGTPSARAGPGGHRLLPVAAGAGAGCALQTSGFGALITRPPSRRRRPLSLNLRTLPPRTETPSFSAHRVGHDADVHQVSHWPQKMIGVWSPHGAGQACLRTPSARDTFLERTLRVTAEVRHEALLGTGERRAAHPRCLSKPRGTQVSVAFSLCLTLDSWDGPLLPARPVGPRPCSPVPAAPSSCKSPGEGAVRGHDGAGTANLPPGLP